MPEGCCYCGCFYPPHGDGLHDSECPAVYDEALEGRCDELELRVLGPYKHPEDDRYLRIQVEVVYRQLLSAEWIKQYLGLDASWVASSYRVLYGGRTSKVCATFDRWQGEGEEPFSPLQVEACQCGASKVKDSTHADWCPKSP